MKKNIHLLMAIIAFGILFGCATAGFGQDNGGSTMVGGYSKAATDDAGVVAAAKLAIKEKRKKGGRFSLVSINSAESQVVAGTNYKLCLRVKSADTKAKAEAKDVQVVVYVPLPRARKKSQLTSWEEKGCGN